MGSVHKLRERSLYSIGQVLAVLQPEFPDLSPSKLRFLEDQGLISPSRTESGYRQYSDDEIQRIRTVLTLQRDRYLPLRVIKERIESGDESALTLPANQTAKTKRARLSTDQLAAESGLQPASLREAIELGLIGPQPHGAHDLEVALALTSLETFGLQPRHLKGLKSAVDREVAIMSGITEPVLRKRAPDSAARAASYATEIAQQFSAIRSHLISAAIEKIES